MSIEAPAEVPASTSTSVPSSAAEEGTGQIVEMVTIDAYRIVRDPRLNLIYVQNWSVTCPVEKASEEEAKLQAQGFKIAKDERDKVIMRMQVIQPPPITDESHEAQLQYLQDISDDEFFDLYLANVDIAKRVIAKRYDLDHLHDTKDRAMLISEVEKVDREARERLINSITNLKATLTSADIDALKALQAQKLIDNSPTAIAVIEGMKAKCKLTQSA